jgi:hypothetical protein
MSIALLFSAAKKKILPAESAARQAKRFLKRAGRALRRVAAAK